MIAAQVVHRRTWTNALTFFQNVGASGASDVGRTDRAKRVMVRRFASSRSAGWMMRLALTAPLFLALSLVAAPAGSAGTDVAAQAKILKTAEDFRSRVD